MEVRFVKSAYLDKASKVCPIVLMDAKRPYMVLHNLQFRGRAYDMAVPLRANIRPDQSSLTYVATHRLEHTRNGNHAGFDMFKLLPVKPSTLHGSYVNEQMEEELQAVEDLIRQKAQRYLDRYDELRVGNKYSVDLDALCKLANRHR